MLVVLGLLVASAILVGVAGRRPDPVHAPWYAAKTMLRGRNEDAGLLAPILATVDDVEVRLDVDDSAGNRGRTFVCAEATHAGVDLSHEGELWLHIAAREGAVPGGGVLEGQVIATGDAAFDARFVTRTNHAALARAWLDAPRRRALTGVARLDVGVARGPVHVRAAGVIDDAASIVQVARAVAAFAHGGDAWVARWEAACIALGAVGVGWLAAEMLCAGHIVRVGVDAALAHTLVTVELARGERSQEELAGIDADLDAWRAAIARGLAHARPVASAPYR